MSSPVPIRNVPLDNGSSNSGASSPIDLAGFRLSDSWMELDKEDQDTNSEIFTHYVFFEPEYRSKDLDLEISLVKNWISFC